MTTTIRQWPTDEDIRTLARNEKPRYKRSRAWRKPPATEPLDKLEFRTVPL